MTTTNICAVNGCHRLAWRSRSRFCSTHMIRAQRYGTPSGQPVRLDQYEHHEAYLDRGLTKYAGTTAVSTALTLAAEVLNLKSTQGFTVQLTMEREMSRLRRHGVTPREFLLRVAAHYAYCRLRPFSDDRAANAALARAVLRLAPLEGYRPNTRLLQWLASEITERLTLFAVKFIERLEADAERERAILRASTDFDTPCLSRRFHHDDHP